jgi:hypothetical protein
MHALSFRHHKRMFYKCLRLHCCFLINDLAIHFNSNLQKPVFISLYEFHRLHYNIHFIVTYLSI